MNRIYTIYKATNTINQKCYIGFDSKWPQRKAAHKHAAKKGANQPLEKAIRKYGFDSFVWVVIYQSYERDHTLNVMENHFIKEYDSYGINGYNITTGGEGAFGWVPSDETKQKIGLANSKKIWTKKERKMLSEASTIKGKKLPEWWVKKASENKAKTYTLMKDGVEVVIKNMAQFCRDNNISAGNMCSLVKGNLKSAYGYTLPQS